MNFYYKTAIMGNETVQEPSPLVKNAQALIVQKDKIESEIRELESALRIQGVGMDSPLVDRSGFPRSDIDVVAARTARNKVIRELHQKPTYRPPRGSRRKSGEKEGGRGESNNGRQDIIADFHCLRLSLSRERTNQHAILLFEAESSTTSAPQTVQPEPQPFAIVNAVAPDSPAKEAGLLKHDKFLRFGSVYAENHQKLQALNEVVAQSENVSVTWDRYE
ncbi:hypothetical protein BC937DRAFT_88962 [Endogone sp. FLAS-F59071]|nr:hypothetical protein BC937DRAFT_88962 [Endogone sp. FLAS-F59071]|eukprot:RUS18285.1 hypothetical protein BC937DRAFT_88962 [Endogone sp. FLAS-F59071]